MHCVFIINPKAGEGLKQKALVREIEEKELDAEIYFTKAPLDASDFVAKYIKEHHNENIRFIACGGDGTINEVFSATVGCPDNITVSVYPCGSGNDFVKVFGGKEHFWDIHSLIKAPIIKTDVMKVSDRYCINVTNFGFDTTVAQTVVDYREKTGHGSIKAYARGVVKAIAKSMDNICTVIADGKILNPNGHMLLCTVSNGQYVGGSFKCSPRALTTDGLLDVCLVHRVSRLKLFALINQYKKGKHIDNPKLKRMLNYIRAKKIQVKAPEGFSYSLDGEIIHENEFSIEVLPKAINFACPE